jgi:hypothetical protein
MACNSTENFILKSGLEVADSATFGGTLSVSGDVIFNATFDVTGLTTFAGGSTYTGGNLTFNSGSGGIRFSDGGYWSYADGILVSNGGITINAGGLTVNDSATFTGGINVTGGTSVFPDVDITRINGLSFPTSDGTSGQLMFTDGSGTLGFDTVINRILDALGGNGNNNQVIRSDGAGNLAFEDLETILGYRFNFGDGAEDGDLLMWDSAQEEFRLSRLSEQHVINGGQY